MARKSLWLLMTLFLSLRIMAQGEEPFIIKGDCTPDILDGGNSHRASRRLPQRKTDWDRDKTYKQMVILFTFSDNEFSVEDSKEYYQKLFNEEGYNLKKGPGCVADYFRGQSSGLCNLEFDVYGPVKVSSVAQPYENPDKNTRNYGRSSIKEATQLVVDDNPDVDYSQYDWNGDGIVEQVIYIYAGPPGNVANSYGYIWPNTSTFDVVTTPDGKKINNYSASGEYWGKKTDGTAVYCGIGTICHEYSHSLGLPDIYPTTSNQGYSVCDEWDLMDGGNFTNWGWCPPNYTALERYLLGWLEFTELEEATSITDLKPISEGGEVYRIKHSDSEWLLLENRQQIKWDSGLPGKGLVIYHVNYDGSVWKGNTVNNDKTKRRFHLVHADNMDYDAWDAYIEEMGWSSYANSDRMNRRYLSTSSYPYISEDEEVVNNELTDTSTPAATMFYPNLNGSMQLDKSITNIQMTDDGVVSFDFKEITKLLVEGHESSEGGIISKSTEEAERKKILTVTPNDGYYVEAKNIRVLAHAPQSEEEEVEVTAVDASADPTGTTQYSYPYAIEYGYQITVDFQKRIDFSKPENYPVITLETTDYEYDGTEKKPEVVSVTYGNGVLVDSSNYEDNINVGEGKVIITGKRYFIGSATATFTIKEASGISAVRKEASNENVYDLQGRQVQTPISGQVYIFREKDGTTRKQIHINAK